MGELEQQIAVARANMRSTKAVAADATREFELARIQRRAAVKAENNATKVAAAANLQEVQKMDAQARKEKDAEVKRRKLDDEHTRRAWRVKARSAEARLRATARAQSSAEAAYVYEHEKTQQLSQVANNEINRLREAILKSEVLEDKKSFAEEIRVWTMKLHKQQAMMVLATTNKAKAVTAAQTAKTAYEVIRKKVISVKDEIDTLHTQMDKLQNSFRSTVDPEYRKVLKVEMNATRTSLRKLQREDAEAEAQRMRRQIRAKKSEVAQKKAIKQKKAEEKKVAEETQRAAHQTKLLKQAKEHMQKDKVRAKESQQKYILATKISSRQSRSAQKAEAAQKSAALKKKEVAMSQLSLAGKHLARDEEKQAEIKAVANDAIEKAFQMSAQANAEARAVARKMAAMSDLHDKALADAKSALKVMKTKLASFEKTAAKEKTQARQAEAQEHKLQLKVKKEAAKLEAASQKRTLEDAQTAKEQEKAVVKADEKRVQNTEKQVQEITDEGLKEMKRAKAQESAAQSEAASQGTGICSSIRG